MNIQLVNYDESKVLKISNKLNLNKEIVSFLLGRGYTESEIKLLTNNDYLQMLPNNNLTNVKEAAIKINNHILNNSDIYIFGDYDVDGVQATYIMYQGIKELAEVLESNSKISYYIPERVEGYGLNIEWCKNIPQNSFVITVDNGIAKVNEVTYLLENNIDVLITDHHQPQHDLVPLNCDIVDAHLYKDDNNACGLCGAAVAYKIISSLYEDIYEYDFEVTKKYLPHVAMATITDMMPVTEENIILVSNGLKLLNEYPYNNHEYLPVSESMYYYAEYNKGSKITAKDISFGFGPQINSCGRLGNIQEAIKFMLSTTYDELEEHYNNMINTNDLRKQLTKEAFETIEPPKLSELALVRIIDVEAGLAGNIANKLLEAYGLVTIILHQSSNKNILIGSARAPKGIDLQYLLSNNKYVEHFGGHEAAAGLTIKIENLDKFTEALSKTILKLPVLPVIEDDAILVDRVLDVKELNRKTVEQYDDVLFFNELRKPVMYLNNVTVKDYGASKNNPDNIYFIFTDGKKTYKVWSWGAGPILKQLDYPNKLNIAFTLDKFKSFLVMDIINIEAAI